MHELQHLPPLQNERLMVERLDLLEEYREAAIIRLAEYQQKLARGYNRDVKIRGFGTRDLVLQKAVGNMRDTNAGKLAPTWEGPYRVTTVAGVGAYYLEDFPSAMEHAQSEEILSLTAHARGCKLNVILYICFVD